ncbi:MAG: hypothetical protein A2498_06645 [Lentisphaerae bacterium RIFOXYC12_FULL_60_16]|nr:MAG: hypothetical protein A2498_06645 [Lentisphaerae bacterium RIFOXYC12_FULL_60_16]
MNRMRTFLAVVVTGLCVLAPLASQAINTAVSLDVASAYVFRGATYNDSWVLQPALEVNRFLPETYGDLAFGTWANFDFDDYPVLDIEKHKFSEVDYYTYYTLPVKAAGITLGYNTYTYPEADDIEDDVDVSLAVGLNCLLAPTVTAYYGIDGGIDKSLYVKTAVSHDFTINDDLSINTAAALGYLSIDEGDDGLSNVSATLGVTYKIVSASLTYFGQPDDDLLPDVEDGGLYDVDLVANFNISYSF